MIDVPVSPIEMAPRGGPILRGVSWGGEPTTLLLHAPGGDIDDWRDLPLLLVHRTGFGVVALDLPGHGLSDGEADVGHDPAHLALLIGAVVAEALPVPPRAVVAAEKTALAVLSATPELDLAGVVCLSPPVARAGEPPVARSPRVPKLFIARSGDGEEIRGVRALAAEAGGWSIVTALAGPGPGAVLLDGPAGAQARDQIAGFLKECLLGR